MNTPIGPMSTQMSLGRIEAFSDGVFAIVVTLLVLEIHVPRLPVHGTGADLGAFLYRILPKVASYVVSFLTVMVFWISHTQFFRWLHHVDRGFLWLNGLLLMVLAFVPFPTGVLGEYLTQPEAIVLYGGVLASAAMMMTLLRIYAIRQDLHHETITEALRYGGLAKSLLAPPLYLLGCGIGWYIPIAGIVIFVSIPMIYVLPGIGHN